MGKLLDFLQYFENVKLTGIDLSKQTNTGFPEQINFTKRLKKDYGATNISITKNKQIFLGILKLSLDSLNLSK